MTEQEFLSRFSKHIKELQKFFIKDKVIETITSGFYCPFSTYNLKPEFKESNEVWLMKQSNEFVDAGGYYIFHPSKDLKEKMVKIIEKEWRKV